MANSAFLYLITSALLSAIPVLGLGLGQTPVQENKPEGLYKWNVTLHDTHPSIQYFPSQSNCIWPNRRDCDSGWQESQYGKSTSAGSLPTTFHHTNNFQSQNPEKHGWKLNIRGTFNVADA